MQCTSEQRSGPFLTLRHYLLASITIAAIPTMARGIIAIDTRLASRVVIYIYPLEGHLHARADLENRSMLARTADAPEHIVYTLSTHISLGSA
jgi:hypothetical protein